MIKSNGFIPIIFLLVLIAMGACVTISAKQKEAELVKRIGVLEQEKQSAEKEVDRLKDRLEQEVIKHKRQLQQDGLQLEEAEIRVGELKGRVNNAEANLRESQRQTLFFASLTPKSSQTFEGNLSHVPWAPPAYQIEHEFGFFIRTVRALPEPPKLAIGSWEILSPESEEKEYVVSFPKRISRYDLIRYIYTIQKEQPFLNVKRCNVENKSGNDNEWRAEIVFVLRRRAK